MGDDALCALLCLIEGESSLYMFRVEPTGSMDIMQLKELIKEKNKNGMLSSIDAKDLVLWKVRMTMASNSTTKSHAG
jgi:Crinkler effector protein N-terminal domain